MEVRAESCGLCRSCGRRTAKGLLAVCTCGGDVQARLRHRGISRSAGPAAAGALYPAFRPPHSAPVLPSHQEAEAEGDAEDARE